MTRKTQEEIYSINHLFHRSIEHRKSAAYYSYLKFLSRFAHYSRLNSAIVHIQNPEITFYGTPGYWKKKFGRTVATTAKPYVILQPFGPISLVYDIMDTLGEETPSELLESGIGGKPFATKGRFDSNRLKRVISSIRSWNIQVDHKPMSFFKGGHITTIASGKLTIAVNEEHTPDVQFSIITHELAHLMLGHTGHRSITKKWTTIQKKEEKSKDVKLPYRKISHHKRELEAETVSYLVCSRLGLEKDSVEYLADFITEESLLDNLDMESIINASDKIDSLFLKDVGYEFN